MTTTDITVNGMTCDHCVNAVTQELQEIDGVTAVRIDLEAGGDSLVHIDHEEPLDPEAVRAAVDEAGYTIV